MDEFWPLFGLRLAFGDVLLRPMTEADLPHLAAVLPGDVGHDPRLAMYESLTYEENERRLFCQGYWKALGTWSPESWVLHFAVSHQGRLVGVQTLEGDNFPVLRIVDSASWLVPGVRGQGLGVAMRTAVVQFAFGELGAAAAITSATTTNAASAGVSRRVGYARNGVSTIVDTSGDVVELQHFRLTAERWSGADVTVTGFPPCRPWFGIAS